MLNIPDKITELLNKDTLYKNFRVEFPNGEYGDIIKANIVSQSVKFTESISSSNEFKLGACESPCIEFETVDVPNIRGALIKCSIEVECPSDVTGAVNREDLGKWMYPIPYGVFIVDTCERQAQMNHRKVIAYGLNILSNLNNPLDDYLYNYPRANSTTITTSAIKRVLTYVNNPDLDGLGLSVNSVKTAYNNVITKSPHWQSGHRVNIRIHEYNYSINTSSDALYYLEKAKKDSSLLKYIKNTIYDYIYANRQYLDDLYYERQNINFFKYLESSFINDISPHFSDMYGVRAIISENKKLLYCKYYTVDNSSILSIPYKVDLYNYETSTVIEEFEIMNVSDITLSQLDDDPILSIYQLTEETEKIEGNNILGNYRLRRDGNFTIDKIYGLLTAYAELNGDFIKTDRYGTPRLFFPNGIYPLFPSNDIYPGQNIFPSGNGACYVALSDQKQTWYDEYLKKYSAVEAKYTDLNDSENAYIEGILKNKDLAIDLDPFYTDITYNIDKDQIFGVVDWSGSEDPSATTIDAGVPFTYIGFVVSTLPSITIRFNASDYDLDAFPARVPMWYFLELAEERGDGFKAEDTIYISVEYTEAYSMKSLYLFGGTFHEKENTSVYDYSDNSIVNSVKLSESLMKQFTEIIAKNIRTLDYMPCSIEMRGIPQIEIGDCLTVETKDGSFNTIVMSQTISGIQSLTTKIDVKGD